MRLRAQKVMACRRLQGREWLAPLSELWKVQY